jgi:hypothetical protein
VHFRLTHFIAAASAFVVLTATSTAAQVLETTAASDSSLPEFQLVGASEAGSICLSAAEDDNIVWGTGASLTELSSGASCTTSEAIDEENIVWGTEADADNIVWGTFVDENIVWGTSLGDDNIVWGTSLGDDNIVWGTSAGVQAEY